MKKDFCEEYGQPCRNGAACESDDTTFSYTCHCQPGYEGERYVTSCDQLCLFVTTLWPLGMCSSFAFGLYFHDITLQL